MSKVILSATVVLFATSTIGPAAAQDPNIVHGRYCGFGNSQTGTRPIDAIDRACMQHDACVGENLIPACGCHVRFEHASAAIARSRRVDPGQRRIAALLHEEVAALPCVPEER